MKKYLILALIASVSLGTIAYNSFGIKPQQTTFGAFGDPFISIQLAPNPSSGNCLTTDGTDNAWGDCGTGGSGGGLATTTPWTAGQLAYVVNNARVTSVATGTIAVPTGLTATANRYVVGGNLTIGLDTGYVIPLQSTLDSFESGLTAGDGLTRTGDDFDFDGGASPGGELGGTWASPTIDDSLAVTSWNLTTPTLTSFFGTACAGNQFLQDIGDTGTFSCATASGGADFSYAQDLGYSITGSSTSTPVKFTQGILASSTSHFSNASSTLLTAVTGWFTNLFIGADTLAEYIADTAGAFFTGNTETGITVTYQDADNTVDVVCNTADTSTFGCLTDTDWDTFNGKESVLTFTWPLIRTTNTITFGGLSTSSAPTIGHLPYFSGVNTFASVATSTPTVTSPITYSGTLGSFVGGVAGTFACATCITTSSILDDLAQTSLADPAADQIVFWDDSDTAFEFISTLAGLAISGNTLTVNDVTCTDCLNATEIEDIFLLNSGDAGTGVFDFGGATSFEIPNGTGPTLNQIGILALDTTSNNLVVATSTTGHIVVASATTTLYSFSLASTSPDFLSGGIIEMPSHFLPQVVTAVWCKVDAGTSQQIFISDGTNDSNTITCTTTGTQYAVTSNNSFTAGEQIRTELVTKSGSPDYLVVRWLGYRTSD